MQEENTIQPETERKDIQSEKHPNANNADKHVTQDKVTEAAHNEALKDIEQDPDLSPAEDPSADLDEGEIARLDNSNDATDVI